MASPKDTNLIFLSQGTLGDLHPIIGLALSAQKAGFVVKIVANEHFAKIIKNYPLKHISIGTEAEYESGFGKTYSGISYKGFQEAIENAIEPAVEEEFKFVKSQFETNKNTVVIAHTSINGGALASIKYKQPFVRLIYAPCWIPSMEAPPWPFGQNSGLYSNKKIARFLYSRSYHYQDKKSLLYKVTTRLREKYGLDKVDGFLEHDGTFSLGLALFPDWFAPRQIDWNHKIELCGFPLFDNVIEDKRLPVDEFISANGAPIVFTIGSGVEADRRFMKESIKACKLMNKPGLFVSRRSYGGFATSGDKIGFADYIDFAHVLPKSLAFIHHGGIGTTAQAIAAGIPQIVRPVFYDQPDNAYRVTKIGLSGFLSPKYYKAKAINSVLDNLFHKDIHIKPREFYKNEMSKNAGIDNAISKLENFCARLD